ncbi:unnamed protein product [Symbiodinium sp. CCMP2592]|nr:unnamed protein product [Symbiodinium sp. CCMP2592]
MWYIGGSRQQWNSCIACVTGPQREQRVKFEVPPRSGSVNSAKRELAAPVRSRSANSLHARDVSFGPIPSSSRSVSRTARAQAAVEKDPKHRSRSTTPSNTRDRTPSTAASSAKTKSPSHGRDATPLAYREHRDFVQPVLGAAHCTWRFLDRGDRGSSKPVEPVPETSSFSRAKRFEDHDTQEPALVKVTSCTVKRAWVLLEMMFDLDETQRFGVSFAKELWERLDDQRLDDIREADTPETRLQNICQSSHHIDVNFDGRRVRKGDGQAGLWEPGTSQILGTQGAGGHRVATDLHGTMESSGTGYSSMSEFNHGVRSILAWRKSSTVAQAGSCKRGSAMLDLPGSDSVGAWRLRCGWAACDSGFSDQAADVDGPKAAGTRHFHGAPHALWLQEGSLGHEGADFVSDASLCDTGKDVATKTVRCTAEQRVRNWLTVRLKDEDAKGGGARSKRHSGQTEVFPPKAQGALMMSDCDFAQEFLWRAACHGLQR